jgi:hypothetical protein
MYPTDFTDTGFVYQERLRAAEQRRRYNRLVESAQAYQRAHDEENVSFLGQIAQRLHLKAQSHAEVEANDSRHAHAV